MGLNTFEDLDVWKRACRLAVDVCCEFDDCKNYTLKDQTQRSAISIPSNIAEGAERSTDGDFVRFLRYAKASCAELRTQLYIARKLSQKLTRPSLDIPDEMINETREIMAMIQGLIFSVQKRSKNKTTSKTSTAEI